MSDAVSQCFKLADSDVACVTEETTNLSRSVIVVDVPRAETGVPAVMRRKTERTLVIVFHNHALIVGSDHAVSLEHFTSQNRVNGSLADFRVC